jgi:hypothetical protein
MNTSNARIEDVPPDVFRPPFRPSLGGLPEPRRPVRLLPPRIVLTPLRRTPRSTLSLSAPSAHAAPSRRSRAWRIAADGTVLCFTRKRRKSSRTFRKRPCSTTSRPWPTRTRSPPGAASPGWPSDALPAEDPGSDRSTLRPRAARRGGMPCSPEAGQAPSTRARAVARHQRRRTQLPPRGRAFIRGATASIMKSTPTRHADQADQAERRGSGGTS